jgi:hypothetical protein
LLFFSDLLCQLVCSSNKFYTCLTTWLLQHKKELDTAGLVGLFCSILNQSPQHKARLLADHKLTKLLLRTVLSHAGSLREAGVEGVAVLVSCNTLLAHLLPALTSPKLTQLLKDFYTVDRESLATVVSSSPESSNFQLESRWLEFQLLVLGVLERTQGGWRRQLAGQLLTPLVDWFLAHLRPGMDSEPARAAAVRSMTRAGEEVVTLLDSSTLRKRLHKVCGTVPVCSVAATVLFTFYPSKWQIRSFPSKASWAELFS